MKKIKQESKLTITASERKLRETIQAEFARHESVLRAHRVRRALAVRYARKSTT
ncbi:MAG: hypothetical protein AAB660_01010 [Patescibacteria group bacterium]